MNRTDVQYRAIVVDLDDEITTFNLTAPAEAEDLAGTVGKPVELIHDGYDPVSDSMWSSFRTFDMPLEHATEAIRHYNRQNLAAKFPSIPRPI